ncbi:MAG: hypothetical protein EOM37_12905 [Proteobacteria bacterium]|nr:hypothetical protein [Pseudomonadota bacterium]
MPLALISSVLNGALEGRDKFMVVNVLQVVSNTVFQVVPLLVAYLLGPGLEYVIPAAVISRAAMNLPFFIACYRTVPFTLMPNFSPNRAKSLFSFGGWVALTGIVSPVMETIDRFLIGVVLGANAVAHYTIAYQLVTKIRILPASLLRALFPRFSSHSNQVEDLAITSFSALIAIMTPVVVMGELLVGPFLSLWVGGDVARHATPIAQIVLVGVWANSLAYIPLGMLQGRGLPGVVAKLQMAELVPFLFLLYLATKEWGVIGAATAWTIRVIVDSTLLLLIAGIAKKAIINTWIPLIFVSVGLVLAVVVTSPAWLLFCGLLLLLCIFSWITTTSVLKMLFVRFRSNENF